MILLTGATGFIGKYLLNELISLYGKENILVFASKPINECNFLLHNNYNFNKEYFVENNFKDIEVILHAGAFTPKSQSDANNIDGSNSNIFNTMKLLDSNMPKLKKILYLSSLDVYDNDSVITEMTNTNPISLYGYSKLYCEKMVEHFSINYNKTYQILRVGHVYGPGEEAYKKIIPIMLQNVINGQDLKMYGDGEEIRSFIYISDVVDAIIKAINLNENIGPINLVSEEKITIKNLIELILKFSEKKIMIEKLASVGQKRNLIFDNRKMKKYLCSPKISINDGLLNEFQYLKKIT